MWSSSGSGFSGAVLSSFDSRVTNKFGGTGSGQSIYFGGVQQEQTYSSGSGDLRRCVATFTGKVNGQSGPLSNSTLAACNSDADVYRSGLSVYIRGEQVKTVTDTCVACCKDSPLSTGDHPHFDNFTTNGACNRVGSLPSALSVILY